MFVVLKFSKSSNFLKKKAKIKTSKKNFPKYNKKFLIKNKFKNSKKTSKKQ